MLDLCPDEGAKTHAMPHIPSKALCLQGVVHGFDEVGARSFVVDLAQYIICIYDARAIAPEWVVDVRQIGGLAAPKRSRNELAAGLFAAILLALVFYSSASPC